MKSLMGTPIEAISIGGISTCIQLKAGSYRIAFDIGTMENNAYHSGNVFITHGHMDHAGAIARHCATRRLKGLTEPTYYVDEHYAGPLQALLELWREIDGSRLNPDAITGISPGTTISLNQNHSVTAFRSTHIIPTLGYAVTSYSKKLKPEFRGLPGKKLGEMRYQGVVLEDLVKNVDVAFCGDTSIQVLRNEELPRRARLLILECTFLDDGVSLESAEKWGHNHMDAIIQGMELFEDNKHLLLTHFSSRYSDRYIIDTVNRRLPDELKGRTSVLLHSGKIQLIPNEE